MKKPYIIVSGDLKHVEVTVTGLLVEGYELAGGVSINSMTDECMQALYFPAHKQIPNELSGYEQGMAIA